LSAGILGAAVRVFAALTAIFAKVGIENINSDYATADPHVIIVGLFLTAILRHR
jgi:uncharacterized membrane protein